jgi:biotin operon repressor
MKSVKEKMLNFLAKDGKYNTFTVAQARARWGVSNVTARINELRDAGHAIYTNTKTLDSGRKIRFYRLGTPSREIVAAGIAALREQGVRAFA